MNEQITSQEKAFNEPEAVVSGIALRPLSAGTLILLKQTKNPLLEGNIDGEDREFHVAAFLYIHSADAKAVRRACADQSAFREAVLEFAEGISIADFSKSAAQIKAICEASVVGMNYEVKDGGDEKSPNA